MQPLLQRTELTFKLRDWMIDVGAGPASSNTVTPRRSRRKMPDEGDSSGVDPSCCRNSPAFFCEVPHAAIAIHYRSLVEVVRVLSRPAPLAVCHQDSECRGVEDRKAATSSIALLPALVAMRASTRLRRKEFASPSAGVVLGPLGPGWRPREM